MSIVKVSANGKSVQFVDDYGNIYITSKSFLLSYIQRNDNKYNPLLLMRLPNKASSSRFKISPLWQDGHKVDMEYPPSLDGTDTLNDSFSEKALIKGKKKKIYSKDILV